MELTSAQLIKLLAATTVVSTGFSVAGSLQQGRAVKRQMVAEAKREGDAARAREIERRRALIRSIASQTAEAGAAGVSPDMSLAKYDIEQSKRDTLTDTANTQSLQANLRARGRNAVTSSRYGAGASLFEGATDIVRTFPKPD